MTKRVLTLVLALLMVLAMVPAAAVKAAAASDFKSSDELIDIIKEWEGYSAKPYWDVSHYSIGYGTTVPDGKLDYYKENGMSKEEAEQALRDYLTDTETRVNSFIDKYQIKATQGIFDALVSIGYNCGSGWLYKDSVLRTAVTEGWTGNDLLFAFGQWSTAGGTTRTSLINRRMAECNMYLNGKYAKKAPANYSYVRFDPNGGECEIKTQCFDTNTTEAIRAVPTYTGYEFVGWYTDPTGGDKVTELDASVKGYMLYARWKAAEGSKAPESTVTGTKVSYSCTVKTAELSAFHTPASNGAQVATYKENAKLSIVAEYVDINGICWGKTSDGGWVNLAFTSAATDSSHKVNVTVTVTGTAVNIRKGAGTNYGSVKQVNKGYKLKITEVKTAGGYTWGKSSEGWIALKYTDYSTAAGNGSTDSNEGTGTTQDKVIATGKVAVNTKLNVRKGAGTGYAIVTRLSNGTSVKIFETKDVGTVTWGRIDKGWISLEYVKLDKQEEEKPEQKPEEKPEEKPEQKPEEKPEEKPDNTVTGTVKVDTRLNVRKGAGTNYAVVTRLKNGTKVTVTEQKTVGKTVWGKIDKGWISLDYVVLDGASKPSTPAKVTGTIDSGTAQLRIREQPDSNVIKGYLKTGDKVTILEQKKVGDVLWGKIDKGWIQMKYVVLDKDSSGGSTTPAKVTGTVTGDYLRIRKGAGTNYGILGHLRIGAKVTILDTKTVGGVKWGKIDKGWISMDYVKLDK